MKLLVYGIRLLQGHTRQGKTVLRGLGIFPLRKGQGRLLIPLQRPEQVDIPNAQGADQTAQKNHQNQQDRNDPPAAFLGVGSPGAVFKMLFVHKKPPVLMDNG